MLPHFQLPPRHKAAGTINPDFSPDQVGTWLAKLPLAAADEAATKLIRFLTAFNRIDLPARHRSQLAGLLKTSAWHLSERLNHDLAKQALPLQATAYRLLNLSQSLLGELANSQKLLILGSLHQGHTNPAAAQLADLIETLDRQLLTAFRTHTSPAPGLWQDLHQCYLCALRRDLAGPPAANGSSPIAAHYKSLLLLAMADPYQFTARELDWALSLARETAPLGTVSAADNSRMALAPFHIHTRRDDPPQPMAREYTKAQDDLLFDTSGIARHLALLGNAIKSRRTAPGLQLPPEPDWPEYLTLLNKLKLRWGASKHRLVKRRQPQQESVYEIRLGLDNLGLLAKADTSDSLNCVTLNDSAGGLALKRSGSLPEHIGVGEVIGLRQRQDDRWQVGLIRWFKQSKEVELMFGLQLLANQFEFAQARQPDSGLRCQALLLQGVGQNQPECLMLPRQFGKVGMQLTLDQVGRQRALVLRQLTEIGPELALFRVDAA